MLLNSGACESLHSEDTTGESVELCGIRFLDTLAERVAQFAPNMLRFLVQLKDCLCLPPYKAAPILCCVGGTQSYRSSYTYVPDLNLDKST